MTRAVDWTGGTVRCDECACPMRPPRADRRQAPWVGTREHRGRGLCSRCYGARWAKERRALPGTPPPAPVAVARGRTVYPGVLTPLGGGRWAWAATLTQGVPVAHQDLAARAALARELAGRRMLLTSRPQISVTYGTGARLLLTFHAETTTRARRTP